MGSFLVRPPASMPGDALLFHRLSDSTIGAVGFHGRVRDGIGWDTDAMVTRQWSRRAYEGSCIDACTFDVLLSGVELIIRPRGQPRVVVDGGTLKRE